MSSTTLYWSSCKMAYQAVLVIHVHSIRLCRFQMTAVDAGHGIIQVCRAYLNLMRKQFIMIPLYSYNHTVDFEEILHHLLWNTANYAIVMGDTIYRLVRDVLHAQYQHHSTSLYISLPFCVCAKKQVQLAAQCAAACGCVSTGRHGAVLQDSGGQAPIFGDDHNCGHSTDHSTSLVGGLEHFLFSHILGIIIPIDSYFSEGFKPPTRSSYKGIPHRGLNTTLLMCWGTNTLMLHSSRYIWRLHGSLLAQFVHPFDSIDCNTGNTEDSETQKTCSRFCQLEWIATFGWPLEGKWQNWSWGAWMRFWMVLVYRWVPVWSIQKCVPNHPNIFFHLHCTHTYIYICISMMFKQPSFTEKMCGHLSSQYIPI